MKKATFLILVLSLLLVSPLSAQSADQLKGVVINSDSDPVPGATIMVEELGTGVAADAEGEFVITDLSAGSYTLVIQSVGYETVRIDYTHPSAEILTVRLKTDTVQADDVIITSSPIGKNIQYQPAQALNAEDLQQKSAPSLGEILDGTPGVTTRSFGSAPARPVIRGFDGDRVLVMQNGERMGDLSATAVDHAVGLDPLAMDRVEVVRGPASLLYGSSAIGGVVNMFSSDMPREWERGTNATIATHVATMNTMGAGLLRAQHGNDRFAVTGRMIYRNAGDLRTPNGQLPDTAIDNLSYGGGMGYRSGNFETGVALTGMDYTYGLPEAIDDMNQSIEIRMNRTNLQSISTLKMDSFFDHAELRIHYSDYAHDEIEINRVSGALVEEVLPISFAQKTVSSSLVLRHRKAGPLEGAVGLSFNRSEISVGGVDALTPDADGYFFAGYLYEELGLGQYFSLKSGVRVEWKETFVKPNALFTDASLFEDRNDLIFSGALGLNFRPSEEWTAGLQVARAYRTPTIEELYSFAPHAAAGSFDVGDPSLENEFSIGSDLFVTYSSQLLTAQLSAFSNRIDNYVDFAPAGEVHEPSGLPIFEYGSKDAILYGFEFFTKVKATNRIAVEAGVDYVRGYERTGDNANLTFMPPLRTQLSLMYDDGTIWAGPRVKIVNRQEKTAPNEDPTDGYLLIGADAGWRLGNGLTLSFRLDNLLNEKYIDHLSRVENRNAPMPGRNLNGILRWEF